MLNLVSVYLPIVSGSLPPSVTTPVHASPHIPQAPCAPRHTGGHADPPALPGGNERCKFYYSSYVQTGKQMKEKNTLKYLHVAVCDTYALG